MIPRVMIVEDEEPLTTLLRYNLEAEGYAVQTVFRGDEAEIRLRETVPDLLLLDWMLPGVSGIELCRRLRMRDETRGLPIIMLTARGEETERVRGLSTGADDYVVKPFSVPELMARIRAVLRRVRPGERSLSAAWLLTASDLSLDRRARRATLSGKTVELTPKALSVLEYLMTHPDEAVTRERLLEAVWGWEYPAGTRTVDTRMAELRRALDDDPTSPRFIETIPGEGYRFIAPVHGEG